MATARRPLGLAEKDKGCDDAKSKGPPGVASLLRSLRAIRRRRIILALLAVALLWLFLKNIPTDVAPVSQRYDKWGAQRPSLKPTPEAEHTAAPDALDHEHLDQDYEGPIKFYKLASSLRAHNSYRDAQENVLFAFSNLKSASPIISAACSMSYQNRTKVHVAILGRQEAVLQEILALNNIPENECLITWHDSQPDHSLESSVERLETSVEAAIGHIHKTLSLQAIFFDDSSHEDDFFVTAIKAKSRQIWVPAIPLPHNDAWMLSLDGHSIKHWSVVQIDIVIQAPTESSGSLIRLLKSVQDADYGGLPYPRITVELPGRSDQSLLDFLSGFRWPPDAMPSERKLTVRRQANAELKDRIAASLFTAESFYPATSTSHVLILSPQSEVSRNYFQLLMYLVFEYKYGGRSNVLASKLMGISLEQSPIGADGGSGLPATLTQLAQRNAALYFGDRWVELHDFLTFRIHADANWKKTVDSAEDKASAGLPWLKAASEMMQAQGKFMLAPALGEGAPPLVIMHTELRQTAENLPSANSGKTTDGGKDDLTLREQGDAVLLKAQRQKDEWEKPMLTASLVSSLLQTVHGEPIDVEKISINGATGKKAHWGEITDQASRYSEKFATAVGGCTSKSRRNGDAGSIGHLFCV